MFTIEHTDLKPCYGLKLADVFQRLSTTFQEEWTCKKPEHLLNYNIHAIKVLEQHPDYVEETVITLNMAMDRFLIDRKHKVDPERCIANYLASNHLLIDTLLQNNTFIDPSYYWLVSQCPRAIPYLRKHPEMIVWSALSRNPEALDLLEDNVEKISFPDLCYNRNPRAIAIIRDNLDKMTFASWCHLIGNPCDEAIDLILEHPQHIQSKHYFLGLNSNPRAIGILRGFNLEHFLAWSDLSRNPCDEAVRLLEEHPDKINWSHLSYYASSKEQFDRLLRVYPNNISWSALSLNHSDEATKLLQENPDRINWHNALKYQNMFETTAIYDYEGIRGARHDLHQEFHAWAGHPSMIATKWKDWGFDTYGLDEPEE
jgi:hypothetical protein